MRSSFLTAEAELGQPRIMEDRSLPVRVDHPALDRLLIPKESAVFFTYCHPRRARPLHIHNLQPLSTYEVHVQQRLLRILFLRGVNYNPDNTWATDCTEIL